MKRITILSIAATLAGAFTLGTLSAPPVAEASNRTVNFAYAGDSLTEWRDSWLRASWDDPTLVKAGGFAKGGYTTGDVLANIGPVSADVLVIMLGTNDMRKGVSISTVLSNLDKIKAKVKNTPRVVLVATPPSNGYTTKNYTLNRAMSTHAWKRGWSFVDPWAKVRGLNQKWLNGTSPDGVHPTAETSQIVESRMERYIRQAYEGTI